MEIEQIRNRPSRHGGYGLIKQLPDHRDYEFLPTVAAHRLPTAKELDISGIPVLDQGQQGSCTGHGTAGIVMYDQKAQSREVVVPSREFIYYNARAYEGTANEDAGAEVRDAVRVVINFGVPPDSDFPYNDRVYNQRPPDQAYSDALKQEGKVYEAVAINQFTQAIASGFPVVFGFVVYESFESDQVASNGIVPMPAPDEPQIGGHCIWAYGYNRHYSETYKNIPPRHVKCRNSWSEQWGDNGDFYLPLDYYSASRGWVSDAWVIRQIS